MKYLILSTYPESGTKNSGDDLLGKSLANILYNVKGENIQVDIISTVDNEPKDIADFGKYTAVLAPALRPTIIGNNVAPVNRSLFLEEAYNNRVPVYAVGSGWKAYPGIIEQSNNLRLDYNDKILLGKLFGDKDNKENSGMISCRDITTENLLKQNGISCFGTTGDCGLFDPKLIQSTHVIPDKIKRVAVSMPHNVYHRNMAYELALQIKNELKCDVSITFHGYKKSFEDEINKDWDNDLIKCVDLAGGAEKLSFYDDIDIHVGFRLHAHIWFLRTRKPSLLLGEDGRGMGHLYTVDGLGFSAATNLSLTTAKLFPKWQKNPIYMLQRRKEPQNLVIDMIKSEINNDYPITRKTLEKVDSLWINKMKPFIEMIP